jgi:hypothetical protein
VSESAVEEVAVCWSRPPVLDVDRGVLDVPADVEVAGPWSSTLVPDVDVWAVGWASSPVSDEDRWTLDVPVAEEGARVVPA